MFIMDCWLAKKSPHFIIWIQGYCLLNYCNAILIKIAKCKVVKRAIVFDLKPLGSNKHYGYRRAKFSIKLRSLDAIDICGQCNVCAGARVKAQFLFEVSGEWTTGRVRELLHQTGDKGGGDQLTGIDESGGKNKSWEISNRNPAQSLGNHNLPRCDVCCQGWTF